MKQLRYIACLSLIGMLSACGGGSAVKETLGLNRQAPDEFRVVSRPPLSVPPQFNLRPPSTGGEVSMVPSTDKQAASLMLGTRPDAAANTFPLNDGSAGTSVSPVQAAPLGVTAGSSAETQLLKNAGAAQADPRVRATLEEEKNIIQDQQEEAAWWDMFGSSTKKEPLVDAKKEAERIKENKAEGKPVNDGETPEVKQRDTGVLGNILGY